MDLVHAAILGIVEGLTEFLPVSSTFHLILTSQLLGLNQTDFLKMFEVVIQFGAVFSLVFLYLRTLLSNKRLLLLLTLSLIPTALIGKLFYPVIEGIFFTNTQLQLVVFSLIGLLFLFVEKLITNGTLRSTKQLSDLTLTQAVLIGIAQAISVIPGISRSGSIILASLSLGLTRPASADYAFLLSIPTILSASLLDLYENRLLLTQTGSSTFLPLLVGFIAAFISAYFVVIWFIKYMRVNTLKPFAYYRFILLVIIILFKVGLSR